jgi:hypothetical protein
VKTGWYVGWMLFAALLLLTQGCSSLYQPRVTTMVLVPPRTSLDPVSGLKTTIPGTTLTSFEQWTSLWSAVCGVVVNYQNGQPAQMIPGNCGTPLTLLLGSPINIGLASAMLH